MQFWIIALAMTLAVTAVIVRAALKGGQETTAGTAADRHAGTDVRIYRDQLAEVDRDLTRGTISSEEAGRLRTEISRRLLSADAATDRAPHQKDEAGPRRALAWGLGAVIVLGSGWLYWSLGAPGYPDLSRKTRLEAASAALAALPDQARAEAEGPAPIAVPGLQPSEEFQTLMTRLRDALASRPDDLQGHLLLARNEAALGNFAAAYKAQKRALELMGDSATGQDYADYADMLILAAGGTISSEASAALRAALARDPENGTAGYYSGLLMAQNGRPDVAFRLWDGLLRQGPQDAPWVPVIRSRIMELAQMAGEPRYQPPSPAETLPGPSAADIAATEDMSPEDRQEMIRGMVESLSERLASQGGSAQEWARLIMALGVLGETTRAGAIYRESQDVFAGQEAALTQLRSAAEQAGVAQ